MKSSGKTALKQQPTIAGSVDLLAMVDLKRDTVNGRWRLVGGKLIGGGETAFEPIQERLQIPYTPPPEYDLILVLERTRTVPTNAEWGRGFGLILTGPHQFNLHLDGNIPGKSFHGLERLDGKAAFENETATTDGEFEQGKKVRVECRLRRGSVTVLLDGKERIRWVGDLTRLEFNDPEWSVPDKTRLALLVKNREYHVHEWKLTPVGKAPANSGSAAAADPDRRAAEYVLSIGGWVKVKGDEREIKAPADLPKGPLALTVVDFQRKKNVTDRGLASFKDCRNLKYLVLQSTDVSDEGLVNFKDSTELSGLNLGFTHVGDAGLAHFKNCKKLNTLALGGTRITDVGLANFKDCKNLKILLLDRTQVGDEGLANFKDGKSLVELNVKDTKVTVQGIAEFAKAQPQCKIEHDGGTVEPTVADDPDRQAAEYVLSVGGKVQVNGEAKDITTKDELPTNPFALTGVKLHGNQSATDAEVANLQACNKLTYLNVRNTKVTAAAIEQFHSAVPKCKIDWNGSAIEPQK